MQVLFRQGIVKAPANFLQVTGSSVGLVIPQPDALLMAFAHGQADYLYTEAASVTNAWVGPFSVGTDYWLYWDIHPTTGAISRGHTLYEPIESAIQPALPVADQHWFDTTANKMKVWNATAGRWVERIRLFAAKLTSGTILTSMSVNSPAYEGTQVGSLVNASTLVGFLVYDEEGKAIRKGNGTFFTTEDVSVTGITSSAQVKLESIVREARAAANMSKRTVVVFSDFDEISPASPVDFTSTKQFGIIEQDVVIGEHVGVVTHGVLTSADWDWSALGVNAPLYVGYSGTLSSTPIPPALHPFAIVTGTQTIQLGTLTNIVNITGGTSEGPMTTTELGIARLSVSAVTPSDPVVVGNNDPRMSDARTPIAHTHVIADVASLQTTLDGKVDVSGDTMLGDLTLAADPTAPLHAATKQYVDTGLATKSDTTHNHDSSYVNVSGDTMTGFLTLSADPTDALHAATKQYVDANSGGGGVGDRVVSTYELASVVDILPGVFVGQEQLIIITPPTGVPPTQAHINMPELPLLLPGTYVSVVMWIQPTSVPINFTFPSEGMTQIPAQDEVYTSYGVTVRLLTVDGINWRVNVLDNYATPLLATAVQYDNYVDSDGFVRLQCAGPRGSVTEVGGVEVYGGDAGVGASGHVLLRAGYSTEADTYGAGVLIQGIGLDDLSRSIVIGADSVVQVSDSVSMTPGRSSISSHSSWVVSGVSDGGSTNLTSKDLGYPIHLRAESSSMIEVNIIGTVGYAAKITAMATTSSMGETTLYGVTTTVIHDSTGGNTSSTLASTGLEDYILNVNVTSVGECFWTAHVDITDVHVEFG